MAAGAECAGSRNEWDDAIFFYGEGIYVSDDMSTNLPVRGTTLFTNKLNVEDTPPNARKAGPMRHDWWTLPGFCVTRVIFKGIRALY